MEVTSDDASPAFASAVDPASDHAANDDDKAQEQRDKQMRNKDRDDREVCRNFLNNRCTRGRQCKFLHPLSSGGGTLPTKRSRSPITSERTDICRDFARNMCTRGKQCRYFHPPVNQVEKHWFNVCLDFQNGKCRRRDCRYFHIRHEDEDQFRHTGEASGYVFTQAIRHALSFDGLLDSTTPVCKDFLKKFCNMKSCRFRHLSRKDFEMEVYSCLLREMENVYNAPLRRPPPGRGPFAPPRQRFESDFVDPYEPEGGLLGPPTLPNEGPEGQIFYLRSEIDRLRDICDNNTDSSGVNQNAELQNKIRILSRENERLNAEKNWSGSDPEIAERCNDLQAQNDELNSRYSKIKADFFALENKKQAMDQYQIFIRDQSGKLMNHTEIFESEFSKMFRGGRPPVLTLSDAWDRLKSTCKHIANSSINVTKAQPEAVPPRNNLFGLPSSINSGMTSNNFATYEEQYARNPMW